MTGRIFLLDGRKRLVPMSEEPYDSEDLLQGLLADYPDLLAGDQINRTAPRRWLLIRRELGVPDHEGGGGRWALDHLFVDQDSVPTLVEVKRSSDSRVRREVVGQMLDYAANGVAYWPVEQLRASFEAQCERDGLDPEQRVQELIGQDGDVDAFWRQLKTNLQSGRVRMVFVADEIPPELQRIIEFLNEQTDPAEVLGVEVRRYAGESLTTLVPRVVGQTAEAQQRKETGAPRRDWDRSSLLAEIEHMRGAEAAAVADRLLDWAARQGLRLWWGGGAVQGSCYLQLDRGDMTHWTFAIWTTGTIALQFGMMASRPVFDDPELRRQLAQRLNKIPGVSLNAAQVDRQRSIPLNALADESAFSGFVETFEWYIEKIRSS